MTICPIAKFPLKLITLVLVLGLSFGLVLNGVSFAQAQETTANQVILTAIPPRLGDDGSLKANPGETLQTSIRVRNTSQAEVNILSQAQDFVIDQDGSTPLPISETTSTRWSLASWLTVAPANQTLQPNETKVISVVIEVPADALPGGHYAMITHQPVPKKALAENGQEVLDSVSGISQKVGTLVYVFVNGEVNEEAYIRNFTIPHLTEYGPVPFSFSVENLSDTHITPNLRLEISNIIGKKVADLPLESKNVFPLAERDFSGQWEQVWGYGYYTATLTMNYGSAGKIAIAKLGFWLFPVTLVIVAILLILIIIATIIVIRSHLKHRQNDQTAHIKELETKLENLENQL